MRLSFPGMPVSSSPPPRRDVAEPSDLADLEERYRRFGEIAAGG